ncbi:hypothetical protein BURMUCGD1_3622 [Burkholderia multivorans CGD1]|nr:hypothetical protein BURMUCGD1_3622 [Burkholderia multivorans CGD1]
MRTVGGPRASARAAETRRAASRRAILATIGPPSKPRAGKQARLDRAMHRPVAADDP